MESTPDDRAHGYDDEQEQEAYEQAAGTDPDAGPASGPDDDLQPDQAEGE